MGIHGVDEDEQIKLSNQKTLLSLVIESDKIVCF